MYMLLKKGALDYSIQKCPRSWVQNYQQVTPKRTYHGDKKEAICWQNYYKKDVTESCQGYKKVSVTF